MTDLRGAQGTRPPGQNFLIFMQFSGKIGQIVCCRPPLGLAHPPLGNPRSATDLWFIWLFGSMIFQAVNPIWVSQPIILSQFYPKTAWKWKKLNLERRWACLAPYRHHSNDIMAGETKDLDNFWIEERMHDPCLSDKEKEKVSNNFNDLYHKLSVADLGFLRGGCANPKGGRQPTICLIFPKTAWKWRNFGWEGGRASLAPPPLRSATDFT